MSKAALQGVLRHSLVKKSLHPKADAAFCAHKFWLKNWGVGLKIRLNLRDPHVTAEIGLVMCLLVICNKEFEIIPCHLKRVNVIFPVQGERQHL